MINYDELPSRGKVTSDGERIRKCHCGGRCYVNYDEDRKYSAYCENGGHIVSFRASSMDLAIKVFNDMPHALLSERECKDPEPYDFVFHREYKARPELKPSKGQIKLGE